MKGSETCALINYCSLPLILLFDSLTESVNSKYQGVKSVNHTPDTRVSKRDKDQGMSICTVNATHGMTC